MTTVHFTAFDWQRPCSQGMHHSQRFLFTHMGTALSWDQNPGFQVQWDECLPEDRPNSMPTRFPKHLKRLADIRLRQGWHIDQGMLGLVKSSLCRGRCIIHA